MKSLLPFIEEHRGQFGGISYYEPYDYDSDDIFEAIRSRNRFKNVTDIIEKINRIGSYEFSHGFSNRYFIHAQNANDARVAMLALYYTISEKTFDTIGNYIVERTAHTVMGMNGPCFGMDDEPEEDYKEKEDLLDKNNPSFTFYHPMFFSEFDDDQKICFMLSVTKDTDAGFNEDFADTSLRNMKQMALKQNMIYIDIEKDSKEDLMEFFCSIITNAGFTTAEISDNMEAVFKGQNSPDEYTLKRFAGYILSKHMLENPDDEALHISDIEEALSILENKTEAPAYKEPKLVGLESEREKIKGIIDMLMLEKKRANLGFAPISSGCNIVFAGPPGTAKTTLARHFAKSLADAGIILDKNNFMECKKSDLVGKYVGWTASMIDDMFKKMAENGGGVIFFDEIYTLSDSQTDFDKEAITCITQNMENYREKVYCIFAGYGDKMDEFLSSNPGLRSRIQFNVKFGDYDTATLKSIFLSIAGNSDFTVTEACEDVINRYFTTLKSLRGNQFGNGREARNLFTNTIQKLAARISGIENIKSTDLTTITKEDILAAADDILSSELGQDTKKTRAIGFIA
ncbi:MAG: AAA family ATPase [Clostridia bacterium]|nr:AAA family ATPase [Clostridia bacterium]